jgi:hypothetical protein
MGIKTEQFKSELISLINHCDLDISVVYYVLKDVLNITEKEYNRMLAYEQQKTTAETEKKEQ